MASNDQASVPDDATTATDNHEKQKRESKTQELKEQS